MNKKVFFNAIILGIASIFTACNDDETIITKPEITILELGEGNSHNNDHSAYVGEEVHIEAEIVAEGKIDKIQVIIHPEGEHKSVKDGEWELDTTYTKFSGLKNTTFHEHLDIADWAAPGDYHFDLIVTDQEGNQSSADEELEIIEE